MTTVTSLFSLFLSIPYAIVWYLLPSISLFKYTTRFAYCYWISSCSVWLSLDMGPISHHETQQLWLYTTNSPSPLVIWLRSSNVACAIMLGQEMSIISIPFNQAMEVHCSQSIILCFWPLLLVTITIIPCLDGSLTGLVYVATKLCIKLPMSVLWFSIFIDWAVPEVFSQ